MEIEVKLEDCDVMVGSGRDVPVPIPIMTSTNKCDDDSVKARIIQELEELGCCSLCIPRYLGINDSNYYQEIVGKGGLSAVGRNSNNGCGDFKAELIEGEENVTHPKLQKINTCIACLGLLQNGIEEEWTAKICSAVKGKYANAVSVCLNVSMPICAQLRAYSLWLHLQKKFPGFYSIIEKLKPEGINTKSVWKWIASGSLQERIYPTCDWSSSGLLRIQVNTSYEDDQTECSLLFNHLTNAMKKGQRRKGDIVSRNSLDLACSKMGYTDFSRIFQCPPSIPSRSVKISSIDCQHAPIFIAGRYCKFSRILSQTPWVIDGIRKTETSVEELISANIISHFQPDDTRFSSSGREDVDVRCLGKGRPFVFELINPKNTTASGDTLRQIQNKINSSTSDVFVRDLQIVDKKDLSILKEGEDTKSKHYGALCSLPKGINVTQEMLDTLNNYPLPIVLNQKTPVRVLHRRSVSCRKRTIFEMKATSITTSPTSLFKLQVTTQAGTYVKEFVHGDLGRTVPNVNQILGVETDLKLLDVESVDIDWPKELP